MKNKILCFSIMSIVWFVSCLACVIFLDVFCIKLVNFVMQEDFYNTKNLAWRVYKIFVFINPLCIVCYYIFPSIRKFWTYLLFSVLMAFIFLGLYILWFSVVGLNPSHKVYFILLAFLMSVLAYFKIRFIHQEIFLEFSVFIVGEIGFITLMITFATD